MKKLLPFFALLFISCSQPTLTTDISFPDLATAGEWIATNINYKSSNELWPTPQAILDARATDCKGFCVLYAYYAKEFNVTVTIITVRYTDYTHAVIKMGNKYFDPQLNAYITPDWLRITNEYSWDYVVAKMK